MRAAATLLAVSFCGATGAGDALVVESWSDTPGTTVALVADPRLPLVELRLVFPVGSWSSWFRNSHGREAFGIQMRDTEGRLRARADALAADVRFYVGSRSSTLVVSCLKQDLQPVAELLREILSNRDFDRRELRRRKQERRLSWQLSNKQPWFRAEQAGARTLFVDGDPRLEPWERPVSFETRPEVLATARDAMIRLPGRVIGFSGEIIREEARRIARDLLPPVMAEPPDGLEPRLLALRDRSERAAELTVRLERLTQVYLSYGRDSMPKVDPDYPALMVANHVLGGHFYSRLSRALRHDGGETYGASSRSFGDVVVGPYAATTFTRADNAGPTETKLRDVLARFHAEGISETEREEAVGYLLGRRAFDRESAVQVLGRYLYEQELGLDPGSLDGFVDLAARVSLAEINRVIASFYDPAGFTMIRVSP